MIIRLAYLIPEAYPTFRVDVSVLFGKWLPHYGVESDIVARRAPGSNHDQEWGGGRVLGWELLGRSRGANHLRSFLHFVKHLVRLDPERYDVIQVRDMPLLAVIGLLVARGKRLPFVYWMSFPVPEGYIQLASDRGLKEGFLKWIFPWIRGYIGRFLLYRIVLKLADHLFVQSDQMMRNMIERGATAERLTSVPMGIDLGSLDIDSIVPAEDPRLRGKKVLVYLGSLDKPRRIEVLFEMLALLKVRIPNAVLVLVGETQEHVHCLWLKKQATKAGVANDVVWTGWLPIEEGWRYVRAAEVALSPIPRGFLLDNGSPTKLVEYLGLGVPVVCNDNPDQEALLQSCSAGRCVRFTAEDFAEAVIALLEASDETRRSMIESGRRYVAEKRDYRLIARGVASQYATILRPREYQ